MGADRIVHGRFRYFPLPRRVAERLFMASEPTPPAFGVATHDAQLATRKATS